VESPLEALVASASKQLQRKKFPHNMKNRKNTIQKSVHGGKLLDFDATFDLHKTRFRFDKPVSNQTTKLPIQGQCSTWNFQKSLHRFDPSLKMFHVEQPGVLAIPKRR
jgi:hypothetical protein